MSRVAIKESVLRWALDRADLTPEGIQHIFPKIVQWISGESQPTLHQLESLARRTLTPLGFFFLEEPPADRMPIPNYRTFDNGTPSKPSPNLLETIQLMQRRQIWMRDFLIEQGQEQLPFVRAAKQGDSPKFVADLIRKKLALDMGWASREQTWTNALSLLRKTMESAGILVVTSGIVGNNTHRKLNPDEFRGFVLVDEYAPLVFVNGSDYKSAQMFTLAHELAHVFFGRSAAFDLREMQPSADPMEQACNRVAAELLVPEFEIISIWNSYGDKPERFKEMSRHFKVSEIVVARRALDLNLINRNVFSDFYRSYQKEELRRVVKSEGGDFFAIQNLRIGRRFASAVFQAVNEGKLLFSDAYQLTGLYGKTFERYAERLRGGERR